jgi:hypothetical protein
VYNAGICSVSLLQALLCGAKKKYDTEFEREICSIFYVQKPSVFLDIINHPVFV